MPKRKITNKIKIMLVINCYLLSAVFWYVYSTINSVRCGGQIKGIYSHFAGYKQENNNKEPNSLKDIIDYSDILTETAFNCPVSNKEYLYFVYSGKSETIAICDATPIHPVYRPGMSVLLDIATFRIFAPRGRNVIYHNGIEGFLSKNDFQKKIEEQSAALTQLKDFPNNQAPRKVSK